MTGFLLRRVLQSVLTVLGVLTAHVLPGTVERRSDHSAAAGRGDRARILRAFAPRSGLDQSWLVQYLKFLANAVEGDFGISLRQRTSALGLVLERLPATLELALTAFVLGILLAFAIGLATRLSNSARLRSVVMWIALGASGDPGLLVRPPADSACSR